MINYNLGAQLNNLGREIEKVYAAQVECKLCKGPHYTKDCLQKEEGKILEEAYYTQFGAPNQPGRQYRAAGRGFYQRNNGNSSHEENSNIIKEIRASTDAAIRNQGDSIKTLEIQIGQMSKVLQERGFGSLPSSTKTNPRDQVKSISTAKADFSEIRRIRHEPYDVSGTKHRSLFFEAVPFPRRLENLGCDDWREAQDVKILDTYDHSLPQKEKDLGSFTLPSLIHNICFDKALVDFGASVSVMPFSTYTNLGLGILSHTRLTRTIKQPRVITEYLVNVSKRRAFWSLNKDILKITILATNTPHPSRKIRRIRACTHQRPQRKQDQYAVSREAQYAILKIMDDPNITMEEYIRLEEEKARKHKKVFNWETIKYGKIWCDEDIHDPRSIETKFPAIAFNDGVSSEKRLSCEPTVSSLNDEIDFRISFDDSDDEDYTVIFDKNLLSYKKISTNDLKTDSKNDNEKVNLPSLPSLRPAISCFDDLDFFKDFENEFPAIIYNNAQMSKSDLLTESILSPRHIDKFDLNDETSLSEYDEEEQNVLYFNDLFPFNIIHPDDLKSEKDNDDNKIDIIQSLGGNEITQGLAFRSTLSGIIRMTSIQECCGGQEQYGVFDFGGLPDLMAEGLSARMLMEHMDAQGAWVAMGPERQPDVAAGAPGVAQDAPAVDEGVQAVLVPVQAPQQPPPPPPPQLLPGLCHIQWTD
ncbi:hypothetical protein Tco_0370797 [Tanacetum coccineum]